jgi:hypothetical protein
MTNLKATIRSAMGKVPRRPGPEPRCSFCGKSKRDVTKIVAGPGVFICDRCIVLCSEVLDEERTTMVAAGASESTLLEQLSLAGNQIHATERHVRGAVSELRGRGMSWAQIGHALGISRQSAWERFSGEQ